MATLAECMITVLPICLTLGETNACAMTCCHILEAPTPCSNIVVQMYLFGTHNTYSTQIFSDVVVTHIVDKLRARQLLQHDREEIPLCAYHCDRIYSQAVPNWLRVNLRYEKQIPRLYACLSRTCPRSTHSHSEFLVVGSHRPFLLRRLSLMNGGRSSFQCYCWTPH